MRRLKWTLFLLATLNLNASSAQELLINEFLASNDAVIRDEDNDSSDWIELFNAGDTAINLSGYSFTDSPDQIGRWRFPEVLMAPGSYLLVWASGKDRINLPNLHTNFKLSAGGEHIQLHAPDGALVDAIEFGVQNTDISFGRLPDGSEQMQFFSTPTPGAPNRGEEPAGLVLSHSSGMYNGSITLSMNTNRTDGVIRYAIGGAKPDDSSAIYQNPIHLDTNTVIRVCVYTNGKPASEITTRTFIMNDAPKLPVLALALHPDSLFSEDRGIHYNWDQQGREWERPLHIALIENNRTVFELNAGIRIHGNITRKGRKKSFRFYFRDEYGKSHLKYPLFPDQIPRITEFKRLVLYCPPSDDPAGGLNYTHISDVLSHALLAEIGGVTSAYRPVSLYLNGQYWGIYWIRERIDAHFVESHFGLTDADMNRHYFGQYIPEVRAGDNIYWEETFDFFNRQALRTHERYEFAADNYFDIPNFIDYHIVQIFSGNDDWPQNNIDRFRDRSGADPRWKMIMWDTGAAWHVNPFDFPMLAWCTRDSMRHDIRPDHPNNVVSTLFLRRFLEMEDFTHQFINRFADLLNTTLSTENVHQHIDRLADLIRKEMPREETRWLTEANGEKWESHIRLIKFFAENRVAFQREEINEVLDLEGLIQVSLKSCRGTGRIGVNSVFPEAVPWQGVYFDEIPLTFTAIPEPGYKFVEWRNASWPRNPVVTIIPRDDLDAEAIFEPECVNHHIVINEICAAGPDAIGPGDWIELANPCRDTLDLSGWTLTFDTTRIVLPESVFILPDSFLVICSDLLQLLRHYPGIGMVVSHRRFDLPDSIGLLQMWDSYGFPADSVNFTHSPDWPVLPGDSLKTLELIDPWTNNAVAENWQVSYNAGTPGRRNSARPLEVTQAETQSALPDEFSLDPNYPNPFNPSTTIRYHLPKASDVQISVFNVFGQNVITLVNQKVEAGSHTVTWNGKNARCRQCDSGMYVIRMCTEGDEMYRKAIYIR